jgi:hypothetical protein
MIVAWTYLLHAYYRSKAIEYHYFKQHGMKKVFDKTKHGAQKFWELERCLNDTNCPIDHDTANNLRFLIGLRHEIEHQMTTRIDDILSARFQACCLNYNEHIKKHFGDELGIEKHLSFSLQFSTISTEQKNLLEEHSDLPAHIQGYIKDFDDALTDEEFGSPKYAYRILFVPKTTNRKGQADRVIEFISSDSPLADSVNKAYAVIKETERPKYLPKQIVDKVKAEGYTKFSTHFHTQLWKTMDAKNQSNEYGVMVAGKQWHWYDSWLEEVRRHCGENPDRYC